MINIINIVDTIEMVNFGIWNAAISTASILKENGFANYLVFPKPKGEIPTDKLIDVEPIELTDLSLKLFLLKIAKLNLQPENTIIATHGTWQYPTKMGRYLQKKGYKWIYTPHGMLEPWSINQKKWLKLIYFHLFENRFSRRADLVRAVSSPEKENLKKWYSQVVCIPNGFSITQSLDFKSNKAVKKVLFLSRLHHKKGIIPLVKAWIASKLYKHAGFELLIAGPDHGELDSLFSLLEMKNELGNIRYLGAIYGDEKVKLLSECSFFALPSFSEGFPTSVVEAMNFGLIPLISQGCNFPEVFANQLGFQFEPMENLSNKLNELLLLQNIDIEKLAEANRTFIHENYSLEIIAEKQIQEFNRLIS